MKLIQKTSAGRIADTLTFVISAETPDRVGDVVIQRGIDLTNFNQNPVALVSHDFSQMPIGVWKNVRVQGDATLADLHLANAGTSRAADIARGLINQGILKAVSVGFRGLVMEPLQRGTKYIKSELLEVSLVSVPMHPRAVMVAKSLNMTETELKSFFLVPSAEDITTKNAQAMQSERYQQVHKRGIYSLILATKARKKQE